MTMSLLLFMIIQIGVTLVICFLYICYKFVAKNPHACVWDESHILLDKYLEK